MRHIKFRGLCVRRKIWVYGFLSNKDVINTDNGRLKVIPESVGQLTPFKDLKGNDVYIGDIAQDIIVGLKSEVVFTDYGNIGLRPLNNEVKDLEYQTIDPSWLCTSAEIIGNIHTDTNSK